MNIKYQIFISSTYEDLKEERDQVIKACLEMGHIPVGMEMFSAADEEQWQIIARQIEASDYYVVIVANKYGSVVGGISYTEKEYDYAISKGVPVLGFVLKDEAMWPSDRSEKDAKSLRKLEAFKKKVRGRPVDFWETKEKLHGQCAIALMKTFNTTPRSGWLPAPEVGSPRVTEELSRLSSENAKLRTELAELRQVGDKSGFEQGEDPYTLDLFLGSPNQKLEITTTWGELFIKAVKCVKADPSVNSLRFEIAAAYSDEASTMWKLSGKDESWVGFDAYFSTEEQFEQIEAQFIALGFIQTDHRNTAENSAIWKLTTDGERQYGLALAKKRVTAE